LTWLETLLITWGCAYAAFLLGRQCDLTAMVKRVPAVATNKRVGTSLLWALALLGAALSIWAIAQKETYLYIPYSVLFAPFGCALRMAMRPLNQRAAWPLGTFSANMLATALSSAMFVLGWRNDVSLSAPHQSAVVQAISAGFCGTSDHLWCRHQ
jgi:hypothetical protein